MRILPVVMIAMLVAACQGDAIPLATDASVDREGEITDLEIAVDLDDFGTLANQAGCDGIGNSCTAQGACCDTHDDCIDRNCPNGMGSVLTCTPLARLLGRCPPACFACHTAVVGCVSACNSNPNAAGCGPSDCCGDPTDPNDDTCGQEQACIDRTGDTPEVVADPCECEERGIDLSKSPPRPAGHCCETTGWGCCQGEGARVPGPGGGGCCAGLVAKNGVCVASGSGSGSGSGS